MSGKTAEHRGRMPSDLGFFETRVLRHVEKQARRLKNGLTVGSRPSHELTVKVGSGRSGWGLELSDSRIVDEQGIGATLFTKTNINLAWSETSSLALPYVSASRVSGMSMRPDSPPLEYAVDKLPSENDFSLAAIVHTLHVAHRLQERFSVTPTLQG